MASPGPQQQKQLHKSKSGLKILTENDESPFLLEEPHWTPDSEVPRCVKCGKSFDFFSRRHHCRRCGKIYCDKDVGYKVALPRFSFVDPVRVCEGCAVVSKKELEFFDKSLRILTSGAVFNVNSSQLENLDETRKFVCKLSSSHKWLELASGEMKHSPIDITKITKVSVLATNSDSGNTVANGITLKYEGKESGDQEITLRATTDATRKLAMAWIASMQKAMKMIFDSRTSVSD